MTIPSLKHLNLLWPVLCAVLGLALLLLEPLPLQALRNSLFDQYQRWHPRPYNDVPVRIIDIDEASLAQLGQWPWPRTRIAELVEKLRASGVAAIGFDVVFAEADRTSPNAMAKQWPLNQATRAVLENLPDHDQVLARGISGADVVLGFVVQSGSVSTTQASTTKLSARPFRYIYAGEPPGRWLHAFDSAVTSRPALEKTAQGNGALSFVPDSDGVVRRVPLVLQLAGEPVPTLTAELLRVAQGERNYVLKAAGNDIGMSEIRIGSLRIPTTARGEMWVHYSHAIPNRYLPAWKILAGEVPPALLEGHIVLIGSSAPGLMDLRFSPLGRIIPGVEAHAQALEQILSGHVLQRPGWARAAEAIAILIGGLAIGFLAMRARALTAAGVTLLFLLLVFAGGWYVFRQHALLLDTVTPALVFIFTFGLGSLIHHWMSEREQRWIRDVFSRYVSPNRVDFLVKHPETMKLGGSLQECSFVFTDLAGFTTLMEGIDPGKAVALLNVYLDRMIAIAFSHEGTLDRIVGDAVAIMFSAPIPQADRRARALACALEMDAFATQYSNALNSQDIPFGKTRIGIHTGQVIVGNFGGSTMLDYRALGDPINTAARLESVNKHLGTQVCLSAATLSGCPDAKVRPVGSLTLKGKTQALQIYEALTANNLTKYAPIDDYNQAYELMAKQTPNAAEAFRDLAVRYPEDPLIALHHRRLAAGERGDLMVMNEK